MNTSWEWSLETEANRILQTARNIGNGFYHANNFPVLEWKENIRLLSQAVYLPKINYSTLPRFWHKASKYDIHTIPVIDTQNYTPALVTKLSYLKLKDPTSTDLIKTWNKHQDQILGTIYSLLPETKNKINSITIVPTYFGTSVSFNAPHTFPTDLYIALRVDMGIHEITEAILSSLIRIDAYNNFHAVWQEVEFFVDYLIIRSPLNELLNKINNKKYLGTITDTRSSINNNTLKESNLFLAEIGAPTFDHPFDVNDDKVLYNNTEIKHLTSRELEILKILIDQSPELVSYDDLSDAIFESDEQYSLYTISKVIERLRKKLDNQGISSSYLVTSRNQGYYLKN